MNYTEEEIRKAYEQGAKDYCRSSKSLTEFLSSDVDEYMDIINLPEPKEEEIPFSYSFLRRKLEWEQFCDLTGVGYYARNEGYEIKDSEIFEITESKAKQYNLI